MENRTTQQNKAIHVWLQELAVELNNRGLDMKTVLKPEVEIPWDVHTTKEYLWRPVQKALLGKESSTDLTTAEVNKVYEVLDRHLLTKFDICLDFPSVHNIITDSFNEHYEKNYPKA